MASAARWLAVAAALTLAATAAAPARADGDPASDYLLGRELFVPSDTGVPSSSAARLQTVLDDAKMHGFRIRVALIGSRYDMGSVTALWRHPETYARFLGQELAFVYKGPLLVVMPNGYGTSTHGKAVPAAQAVVDRLPKPASMATSADAAVRAVVALAAREHVVLRAPAAGASASSSTTRDRVTIAVAALAAALLAGAVWWGRRRLGHRRAT